MAVMDAYIRVSRVGDREGDSYRSPQIQQDEIERWAKNNEVTIGKLLTDENVSGAVPVEKRKLEKLIKRAEAGVSEGIIVFRTSRFARDSYELFSAVKRLKEADARLVGAGDGVDTDQPGGKLILSVLAAIAENYLDEIRGGWKASVDRAVAAGIHVASKAPLGYLRMDVVEPTFKEDGELIKNGRLLVDPVVAPVIKRAFEMRAIERLPYQAVADYMSEQLGRAIVRSTVRSILKNRAYVGEARGPNKATNPDAHEPIISVELFEAAAPERATHRPRIGSWAEGALLSGLITCEACGYKLRTTASTNSKTGEREASYICGRRHSTGDCPSPAGARVKGVDEFVLNRLQEDDGTIASSVRDAESRVMRASADVQRAERELDAWIEDVTKLDVLGKDRYNHGMEVRQTALDDARRVLWDMDDVDVDESSILFGDSDQPMTYEVWGEDVEADRRRLRRVIDSVSLGKADPKRRRWQPLEERLTVSWKGATEPV